MNQTTAACSASSLRPAMPAVLDPADLLTPEQAAQLLGLSDRTLATWRSKGRHGLAWIRVGGRIRYSKAALTAWLQSRQRTSTTSPAQGVA